MNYCASGQKFPVRSLELSLQATVHFKEGSTEDLPFYVGSNSYIEVIAERFSYDSVVVVILKPMS